MRASSNADNPGSAALRIGLIADTHGLLRPEVRAALAGVDAIIHAGDIGSSAILEDLREIAPVHAVRGNNDRAPWARDLAECLDLTFGGLRIHVIHDLHELQDKSLPAGTRVVVSGHSHQPRIQERGERLWINPGSAGPRRFRLPVTLAELQVRDAWPLARILPLV